MQRSRYRSGANESEEGGVTRPRVVITTWRRPLPTFLGERTLLYTLGDEYVRCVAEAGATPLLLPHLRADEIDEVLAVADGLLVAGGDDVDPATYGAADEGSHGTDPAADASELRLLHVARRRRLPTLAVCRGMQLVNVAFGGTLRQDIGRPGTSHEPIPDEPDAVLAATHPIHVEPDSRLGAVLGRDRHEVNTIHHQAVDRLGEGLRVTASAPDGIVEGLETDDGWPMIAVQWHPEKPSGDRPADGELFAWLRDAAAATRSLGVGEASPAH